MGLGSVVDGVPSLTLLTPSLVLKLNLYGEETSNSHSKVVFMFLPVLQVSCVVFTPSRLSPAGRIPNASG